MSKRNRALVVLDRFGIRSELGEPYGSKPLVEWGSVTKTVTAATARTVMLEQGVALDTPVRELTTSLKITSAFTVRELLTHRAGLPRVHDGMSAGVVGDPYDGLAFADLQPTLERDTAPRERKDYSNLGYALLGLVISDLTGSPWFDVARRTVLEPLGLMTATLAPPAEQRALISSWRGKPREPWTIAAGPYAPAGGLWSTLDDIIRFGSRAAELNPELIGWEQRDGLTWHSGQTRDAGVCLLLGSDVTVLAHTLSAIPGTADRMAVRRLEHERGQTP